MQNIRRPFRPGKAQPVMTFPNPFSICDNEDFLIDTSHSTIVLAWGREWFVGFNISGLERNDVHHLVLDPIRVNSSTLREILGNSLSKVMTNNYTWF